MPNIDEMFPSKWLKATDISRPVVVTIESVELADLPGGEQKWALYFRGKDRGMVLNRTNSEAIADLHGRNSDDWLGKKIELFTMRVQGPNGPTQGIRVKGVAEAEAAPEKAPEPAADFDDDIPF